MSGNERVRKFLSLSRFHGVLVSGLTFVDWPSNIGGMPAHGPAFRRKRESKPWCPLLTRQPGSGHRPPKWPLTRGITNRTIVLNPNTSNRLFGALNHPIVQSQLKTKMSGFCTQLYTTGHVTREAPRIVRPKPRLAPSQWHEILAYPVSSQESVRAKKGFGRRQESQTEHT